MSSARRPLIAFAIIATALTLVPLCALGSSVAASSPMSNALCIGATWLTGNVGRAIATIGVAIIGIWKLLGKISGRIALVGMVGIAVVFGATDLVAILGGTISASSGSSVITTTNCT